MSSLSRDPIMDNEQLEEYVEPKISPPPDGVIGRTSDFVRLWSVRLSTLPRDMRGLYRYVQLKLKIYHAQKNNLSVPKLFQSIVQKHPHKVAFYFEDETWTFTQVDQLSNRVGNYFAAQGIKHGDAIGIFMENSVEYICLWLGL